MRRDHRKRTAIETPVALLSDDTSLSLMKRRPMSTSFGAIVVCLRALAGVAWIGAFALLWPELSAEEHLSPSISSLAISIVVATGGVGVLALLLLAFFVWRGSNVARVLVLLGLTGSIISAAFAYFSMGEEITIRTTLITLSLDILVLLALSSRDARTWARQRQQRKALAQAG